MLRLKLSLVFIVVLISCSVPKIRFLKECADLNPTTFLAKMEAKEAKYSVIIFKERFERDSINIYNSVTSFFKGSLTTDRRSGLTDFIRVENNIDIICKDVKRNYSFKLKSKYLNKYKFIYIGRDFYLTESAYEVTYSNTLCGVK